jgi:hypothetical protein
MTSCTTWKSIAPQISRHPGRTSGQLRSSFATVITAMSITKVEQIRGLAAHALTATPPSTPKPESTLGKLPTADEPRAKWQAGRSLSGRGRS